MIGFDEHLDPDQLGLMNSLTSPLKIQDFLDSVPYSAEDANRSPLSVLRDRQAHCLDGGLFAAAALRRLGYPPLLVDMFPDPGMDDDHVLAIYRRGKYYGAVAKSNFVGLRFREAVYRSIRELALSYFNDFFNMDGVKTLRTYTLPLNLTAFDRLSWMWSDAGLDQIEHRLAQMHRFVLVSPEVAGTLSLVDPLSYRAGMLVVNREGLYQPKRGSDS